MLAESLAQDETLRELLDRLVAQWQPEEIILFGSRARGEARAGSDYDLLVVVQQASEPIWRRAQLAHRAMWGIRCAVDVLVLTRGELAQQGARYWTAAAAALREGRTLYAA